MKFIPQLISLWGENALFGLALKQNFENFYLKSDSVKVWEIVQDQAKALMYIQPGEYADNGLFNPVTKEITYINSKSLGLISTSCILSILRTRDSSLDSYSNALLTYINTDYPHLSELESDISRHFQYKIASNNGRHFS